MVYTLGESLLDIIFSDSNNLEARPGGGMLNTAVSLGRSGVEVSLISELGDDETAQLIIGFLEENQVGYKYIKKYYHQRSSIALAFLDKQKVPSFSIYKSYPENRRLISPPAFTEDDILVYGSLYSLDPAIRNDLVTILVSAKQAGTILCYDPNIRHHNLDKPEIKKALIENFGFADIIKGSDEDFRNIFGQIPPEECYRELNAKNGDAMFIYTKGAKGVLAYWQGWYIELPAVKTEVVSTIGAGDAFNAGIVYYLSTIKTKKRNIKEMDNKEFEEMIKSGLQFSAAVCGTMDNYVGQIFR